MLFDGHAVEALTGLAETLRKYPHGRPVEGEARTTAGWACVKLAGDQDKGRTLWKLIVQDCGGYMPSAAALALIRAANVENLIPDVEAPEPS